MSEQNTTRLSFAVLDKEKGISEPLATSGEEYPLPAWYRSIREMPLDQLSIEDISKALRQNIHLENVVPLALKRLQVEPLAGDLFDGELLVSFRRVPATYWLEHSTEYLSLKSVIKTVLESSEVANAIRQDAEELLRKSL